MQFLRSSAFHFLRSVFKAGVIMANLLSILRWFSKLFSALFKAESTADLCLQDAVRLSRQSENCDPCNKSVAIQVDRH